MNKRQILYLIITFLIANLFYQESTGINIPIAAVLLAILFGITTYWNRSKTTSLSLYEWGIIFFLVFNSFTFFITNSILSFVLLAISVILFATTSSTYKLSIPLGIVNGFLSISMGYLKSIEGIVQFFQQSKKSNTSKTYVLRFLLVVVPLLFFILFLKLYQEADDTFREMTAFINLNWISWGFIFFYLLLALTLSGLYFTYSSAFLRRFEENHTNEISDEHSDKVYSYMGHKNEKILAFTILILLNAMLIFYNVLDLKYAIVDLHSSTRSINYSALVHGGINALITSIILVILILTFIFRGQLNFKDNKGLKSLALIWLFLNVIIIVTSGIKNYAYISNWGLTYKRIGVFIYLGLACIGIILTAFKLTHIKSIWFLIRRLSFTFVLCFSLLGAVKWNKFIVKHNLSSLPIERIDFRYLFELGPSTYSPLYNYYFAHRSNPIIYENNMDWNRLMNAANNVKEGILERQKSTTWRSYSYYENQLLNELIYIPSTSNHQ